MYHSSHWHWLVGSNLGSNLGHEIKTCSGDSQVSYTVADRLLYTTIVLSIGCHILFSYIVIIVYKIDDKGMLISV